MLSRVADSLYWMARYLERAEHTSRVIAVHLEMMLDQRAQSADERWGRVLASLGDPLPSGDAGSLTEALLYGTRCRGSIIACISAARENCRQARDQVSTQMWVDLNRLYHDVRRHAADDSRTLHAMEFLQDVERAIHQFRGVSDSTMSHSEGWQFISAGQFLERALNTATILDTHFMRESGHLEWLALLRSCTAFEAYRRAHTVDLRPDKAAGFLMLESDFPHSIRFAADRVSRALNGMPASDSQGSRATRLAGRLSASLSFVQIEEMIADGIRTHLDDVKRQCIAIHSAILEGYTDYPVEAALSA